MIKSLAFALLGLPSLLMAQDLNCYNRIGGSWQFGTAPSGCNISPLLSLPNVEREYGKIIFDQNLSNARESYLSWMFPVLREAGIYYLKRRNPQMSQAEVRGFLLGLYALAHQESFWTHYRNAHDGIVHYMRGDNLHGHGMMQVDDRSHVAALKQGRGVDLVYNIIYGLDVYYGAWVRSAGARCVRSPTDYVSRARSAWAAYNGGPRAICRWTSGGATDRDFYARYNAQSWLGFVRDVNAISPIDVRCLAEGPRPCAASNEPPGPFVQTGWKPEVIPAVILNSTRAYLDELSRLMKCYEQACEFPHSDERSYEFSLGRTIRAHLNGLAAQSEFTPDPRLRHLLDRLMQNDDGFVVEGALMVLAKLPPSRESLIATIKALDGLADAELIPSLLGELRRYATGSDLDAVEEALIKAILSGSPFVAEAVSENIKPFVTAENRTRFVELAARLGRSTAQLNILEAIKK